MSTAVRTPASGAPHQRTQPRSVGQADRTLDQVVARRGDAQRHGDASQVEGKTGEAGPGPVEVDDHGPVPQVDAVRDGPDEVQRPPGEGTGEPARIDQAGVGDDEGGEPGAEEEATLEHEVRGQAAGRARDDPEHAEGDARTAGPTTWRERRTRRFGWVRDAAMKATVAPAMRSKSRVSVP